MGLLYAGLFIVVLQNILHMTTVQVGDPPDLQSKTPRRARVCRRGCGWFRCSLVDQLSTRSLACWTDSEPVESSSSMNCGSHLAWLSSTASEFMRVSSARARVASAWAFSQHSGGWCSPRRLDLGLVDQCIGTDVGAGLDEDVTLSF